MKKLLLFDFDGLLVDSEPLQYEARRLAFREIGIELTLSEFLEHWMSGKNTKQFCQNRNLSQKEESHIRKMRETHYFNLIHTTLELHKGVKDFLEQAKEQRHTMVVCSNSERDHIEKILKKFSLDSYFKEIYTGDDVENLKPEPDIYLHAQEKNGFKKEACIIFENSHIGLEAAKRAGITCYCIPDEYSKIIGSLDTPHIFESITDCPL